MGYIVGFVGLCLSSAWIKKTKVQYSPGGIFCLYWGVISLLAQLGLFGLFSVSTKMYLLVLFGIIFFSLGCVMQSCISKQCRKTSFYHTHQVNQKMFFGSCAITFTGLFILDCNAVKIIFQYGASLLEIRYDYTGSVLKGELLTLYRFLVYPLLLMIVVMFMAQTAQNRKMDYKFCIFSFLLTLMDLLAVGDRLVLYFWIVGFVFLYVYLMKKMLMKHIVKKIKLLITVVGALILGVFAIRGTENIIKSIYSYFTGGMVYSTIVWDRIDSGEPLFFWASYQGALRPIMGVLERFNITNAYFDEATRFLLSNQNSVVKIAEGGKYFNYFTTCFAYFYRDLKDVGVVINCFIWGFVSNIVYKKMKKDKSCMAVGNYIFILVSIAMGMIDYALAEVTFAWAMVYYNIHFFKSRKCKKIVLKIARQ